MKKMTNQKRLKSGQQIIKNEKRNDKIENNEPLTSATRKPGFGASLTEN